MTDDMLKVVIQGDRKKKINPLVFLYLHPIPTIGTAQAAKHFHGLIYLVHHNTSIQEKTEKQYRQHNEIKKF